MKTSTQDTIRDLLAPAKAWLAWWWDVVLRALPPNWSVRSRLFVPSVWVSLEPAGIRLAWQAAPGMAPEDLGTLTAEQSPDDVLGQRATLKPRWLLVVSASQAVLKDVTFPAAVRNRLAEVLRFELDRHTPFSAETAIFGYEEQPSDLPGRMAIRIAAVPRRVLQQQLDALVRQGVAAEGIAVRTGADGADGADGAGIIHMQWTPDTPLPDRTAPRRALAVTAVLLVALLLAPLLVKRFAVHHMEQQYAAILHDARSVAAVDRRRELIQEKLLFPPREREARRRVIDLLRDLTEALPDHSHVHGLRFEDGNVRIDGQTASAAELVELLEALASLEEVRFLSPTSRVDAQNERFQIGARITPGMPPAAPRGRDGATP